LETLADPATTVHIPDPIAGVLPFSVENEVQIVESNPAFAAVGKLSTIMVTSSNTAGQTPLLIVHLKMLLPGDNEVSDVKGFEGSEIVPVPETRVQLPVPVTGMLPVIVVVLLHIV
jgi:hypothetical protein